MQGSNPADPCPLFLQRAIPSARWLLGSPPSSVVRQLAPRAWCPLRCLLAKTVGVLSPGAGRSEEQEKEQKEGEPQRYSRGTQKKKKKYVSVATRTAV